MDQKETNDNNYIIESMRKFKSLFTNDIIIILIIINIVTNIYLLIENSKKSKIISKIIDLKNTYDYKNNIFKNNFDNNDKEMIGLYYPEIIFDKLKAGLKNLNIISTLVEFFNQMETKLIYLEKEINVTKKVSFYTSRKLYLKHLNISYDDTNITELHKIVNWITIHKSDQLKGIASDKYLACKYVELKLGKNLCPHKIAIYNKFEELNHKELSKYGDIVLKVSTACWKTVMIPKNLTMDIYKERMEKIKKLFEYDHGLVDMQYFHLYPKKRIIVEKQFSPLTDLYEFKFYIVNNIIKFIYLEYYFSNTDKIYMIYDSNFNFIFKNKNINAKPVNMSDLFEKSVLEKAKEYAIKLSEDFKNFIRVDLYLFHNGIYLSELTFASYTGKPMDRDEKYVKDAAANFSLKIDYN